jgi:hypothetical protein
LRAITRELDVPVHTMTNMRVWSFLVRSQGWKVISIKTPKLLLDGNYSISFAQWQQVAERNLRHHYRKLNSEPGDLHKPKRGNVS